jgi:hypothetical protein
MANNVVTIKIDADTGDAVKDIENVKESVKDVSKETEKGTASFSAFGDAADAVSGGMISGFRSAKAAIGGLSKGFKGLRGVIISTGIGALVVLLGSLAAYFSSTEEGAKKLKIATEFLSIVFGKLMGFASKLGEFIVTAFTSPQEAIDKLKLALEPVLEFFKDINTIIVGQVMKGFKKLSSTIAFLASKYFELTGNQEKADIAMANSIRYSEEAAIINQAQADSWNDIKDAVGDAADAIVDGFKEIIDETNDALDIASRYAAAQFATRDLIQKLTVDNAKLNRTIEEQQKVIDDTTKSYEERKEALLIQSEASARLAQNIAKQARAEESLLHQQIAITNTYAEREELESELADKIAQRIDAEKQINIVNLDNAQKSREIDREELDRKRTILQQINELRLEALNNETLVEAERLALAEKTGLEELELLRASEEEKQAVRDYYATIRANKEAEQQVAGAAAQKVLDDKELSDAQQVADAKKQLAGAAFSAIQDLAVMFGEGDEKRARKAFEINKALNIGKALISTYQAVNTIIKAEDIPSAAKPFVIAAAVGTGLVNVAKIKSTQFGSVSGGPPPSPPSFGGSGGSSSAPQLNTDALQTDNQTSIRAYVVSKDVTTASAQNQQIEQQANLVL